MECYLPLFFVEHVDFLVFLKKGTKFKGNLISTDIYLVILLYHCLSSILQVLIQQHVPNLFQQSGQAARRANNCRCRRQRQIIDLRATDKSQYFATAEFKVSSNSFKVSFKLIQLQSWTKYMAKMAFYSPFPNINVVCANTRVFTRGFSRK